MMRTELVKLNEVQSVYNGRQGMCCCGCSGRHSVPTTVDRAAYKKSHGYEVDHDDISDKRVEFVMKKVNVAIAEGKVECGGSYLAANTPTRVYIVYLLDVVK